MSKVENPVLKDIDINMTLPDEHVEKFNDEKNNNQSIGELHQLLGETFVGEVFIFETNDSDGTSSDAIINTEYDSLAAEETPEISVLEELETLLNSSTMHADAEFSVQTTGQFSVENDNNNMSALDELKAFLDDTAQVEEKVDDIEIPPVFVSESSLENHRSVFDELQNLLQSCIEQLKIDESQISAKNIIDSISVFTDVAYPDRDELQSLLETTLNQLMLLPDNSVITTSIDSISVLDELKNFMSETETPAELDNLLVDDDFSATSESKTDEYEISSIDDMSGIGTSPDSIIDELNLLLDNADSQTFDLASEPDYPVTDTYDENSTMDELTSYMVELSDDINTDDETSIKETNEDTTGGEVVSTSNTLEELEAMLNEINLSTEDKNSGSTEASKNDFSNENETRQLLNNKKEVLENNSEVYDKTQSVEKVADNIKPGKMIANAAVEENIKLSYESDNGSRIPIVGLLFSIVFAVGIYNVWSLLYVDNDAINRSEKMRINKENKPTTAFENSMHISSGKTPTKLASDKADSIYDLLKKMEVSNYVPISSDANKPLLSETIEKNIKNKVVHNQRIENVYVESENKPADTANLQMEKILQKNKKSLHQLNVRMAKAEASIAQLQKEKITVNQRYLTNSLSPSPSTPLEIPVKPELPIKREIIKQTPQKVSSYSVQDKDISLWSVHLASYYGKPPPANELEYLEKAGISYEIKKTIINEKIWYRVIVDKFSYYKKAEKYSDNIRKKIDRKDVWINNSQ